MRHYPDVEPNPDFAKLEKNILAFWQKEKTFRASVKHRPSKLSGGESNEFIFYDGPPFANGLPHYGHLLTGFVKDLFARYQTMRGRRVERRFGWDCHGLPAEMGSEKELNISGRQAIQQFGIDKFNKHCRESVMKYTQEWESYVSRQARWVDFANDYKTMDTNFMESVLWAFKQLWEKELVYEAYRVMPYSWAAETPLSNFETKLDNAYREREDKAITVAFELTKAPAGAGDADKYYIAAWTTTPWTLPSNLALAVGDLTYVCVRANHPDRNNESECHIVSKKAAFDYEQALEKLGYNVVELYSQMEHIPENRSWIELQKNDLVGLTYKPLFPYFEGHKNAFRILDGSSFVTDGDGTGVVHMAPGFGEDDQKCCEANGIEIVVPVDGQGKFTDAIFDLEDTRSPLAGEHDAPKRVGGGKTDFATEKAQAMRKDPTDAEKALWNHLNREQLGYKFRRQQPIGHYIVDFYNAEKRLVVELDGGQHADNPRDVERTQWLESQGLKVLRFWNNDVLQNTNGVLERIGEMLKNTPHAVSTETAAPPQGGSARLSLKGLNVIAQTEGASADEPYKPEQLKKYGLANLRIIQWLKMTGHLIKQEDFKHNYPHCWRTDTPLIYRAMPSWYVEVTKFRDRAVELNQQINWIPEHIRDGQMAHMLATAPDWSISRNRFWGTPIPVWKGSKGGIKAFGSIAELEAFFGTKVEDLHRPFIDTLTKTDEHGETWTRVEDVFDCWFESGSMPFAQVHYPFENKDWFESHFPADFITEYVGQTRGWFNTLIMLSTALFDKPPFLNCICHGVVLDSETGLKYSKRLKNYQDPMEVMDKFGADALRWMMLASPVMRGHDLAVDPEGKFIRDVVRLAIKPVWNAYNFFCLYATADHVEAHLLYDISNGFDSWRIPEHPMDRYILSKLAIAALGVADSLDAYDTVAACEAVSSFFEDMNNWYIRRNKPRFWKETHDGDKQDAYDTLYTCLHVMCRVIAPLLPLVAEEIYSGLTQRGEKRADGSVHLADFPAYPNMENLIDQQITQDMDRVKDICNAALAVRNARSLRVRLPLSTLTVVSQGFTFPEEFEDIIRDEINVKRVESSEAFDRYASLKLQVNFPRIGARLGQKTKEVIPAIKKGAWKQLKDGRVEVAGEVLESDEFELLLEARPEFKDSAQALTSNDTLVVLDINMTPELEQEGLARDLVRLIQQARKDGGLNVSDRIELFIDMPPPVAAAVRTHKAYIMEQTLSAQVVHGEPIGASFKTEATLDVHNITLGFSKVK